MGKCVSQIPTASAISQLVIPHFGLGLGIGVTDAALVPFLANLVDTHHAAHYGSVYSLEQTAVSLAYFLGPFAGGELVETIGFSWLMRIVGLLNILYCPLLFILIFREARQTKKGSIVDSSTWLMNYQSNVNTSQSKNFAYKQFTDASDSE
ncbi:Vesicular acetylcholine transporter [Gryllus bimaculatus]|nr:Vesicular acetylcholine transporter [Gryllus bimaculatus]